MPSGPFTSPHFTWLLVVHVVLLITIYYAIYQAMTCKIDCPTNVATQYRINNIMQNHNKQFNNNE